MGMAAIDEHFLRDLRTLILQLVRKGCMITRFSNGVIYNLQRVAAKKKKILRLGTVKSFFVCFFFRGKGLKDSEDEKREKRLGISKNNQLKMSVDSSGPEAIDATSDLLITSGFC